MIAYFISPSEETERWQVDPAQLTAQLRTRWPEVQLSDDFLNKSSLLEWEQEMPEGQVQGALAHDGQVVILEGDVDDCAKVAAWFRTTVPDWQELLFYDEGYNVHVSLLPGITAEEIARPFLVPSSA